LLGEPAIDLLGEINQSASHLNEIDRPRFEPPEAIGQPLELMRSPRADLGKRRRRDNPLASSPMQRQHRRCSRTAVASGVNAGIGVQVDPFKLLVRGLSSGRISIRRL